MAYTKFNDPWENLPSEVTPISAAALDHIEDGVFDAADDADTALAALAGKVDETGTASQVYGTNGAGSQTTLDYDQASSADSIAQRNANGTLTVADPTAATHAASRQYLEANAVENFSGQDLVLWRGTQAEYDALGVYDPDTVYIVEP